MRSITLVGLALSLLGQFGRIHSSVADDPIAAGRHRSFIVTHALGGALAIVALPACLLFAGPIDGFIVATLVWLSMPLAIAMYLSRTGALETAHLLSAINLAGVITFVAAHTGGIGSFALVWLAVVPVEASLSSRRVTVAALIIALLALAGLYGGEHAAWLPLPRAAGALGGTAMDAVGVGSAILYAGLVVATAQLLARRSEQAARDGEHRYRLLANNATDLISLHRENGQALFVSHGARRLFNRDASDLLGDGYLDALEEADRCVYLSALSDACRTRHECSAEFQIAGDGGWATPKWVECRCRQLTDDDEEASDSGVIVAVTRDISDRRAREDELRRARDDAESASRAKSRFLASISHELRTPLNAIIGFTDVLLAAHDAKVASPSGQECVELIAESGTHLLKAVNDLIDMSKIEVGQYRIEPEQFSLADALHHCVEAVSVVAQARNITINIDAPDSLPTIIADKRAVDQILFNLVSNAIKFSHPGEAVNIGACECEQAILIHVVDTGVGIATEVLPRLGEPFMQGDDAYDRSYDGTGLGLSIVKGLVGLHGGELVIDSACGRGTKVTVRLPRFGLRLDEKDGAFSRSNELPIAAFG